jgi:hypothetical protein
MPVVLVGSAVCSTQRQQVRVDAGDVRDQQHSEEAVIGHDEDHLETLLLQVVFQPFMAWHEIWRSIMGFFEEVGGDAAVGSFFYVANGITGFDNEEFSDVGEEFFWSQM